MSSSPLRGGAIFAFGKAAVLKNSYNSTEKNTNG